MSWVKSEALWRGEIYHSLHDGTHIKINEWEIWYVKDGWQTAQLIDGSYTNHQFFPHLEEAIGRITTEIYNYCCKTYEGMLKGNTTDQISYHDSDL